VSSAVEEEAKIAIENGDINENGVPMITVIADGAWSKRSYRTNYNALSGVVSMKNELKTIHYF
jgi:flagellar basal body rod protein FlgC